MKTLRIITLAIITVLVISAWAPTYAYAMPAGEHSAATANLSKSQQAQLIVNNHTGGTLYVRLSGPRSYSFAATKQGKTVFSNIEPGKYTVVLSTSACQGSLTYKINMKKCGKYNLKQVFCR
jgi:hypothetical protein